MDPIETMGDGALGGPVVFEKAIASSLGAFGYAPSSIDSSAAESAAASSSFMP